MNANQLLLYRLAELMLTHEEHVLPVDMLFDDEQIGEFVKSIQIDSPYQQLLMEGVLTETVKDGMLYVSFTVEGYFHFVLGEVLHVRSNNQPIGYLLDIAQTNRLTGLHEGISHALVRKGAEGQFDPVMQFVDAGLPFSTIGIVPLAMAFLTTEAAGLIEQLLKNESEHDYSVLGSVLDFLSNNNKHATVEGVWNQLLPRFGDFEFSRMPFMKAQMCVRAFGYKEESDVEEIAGRIVEVGTTFFSAFQAVEQSALQVDLYNILVSKGLLATANRFAEIFGIYRQSVDVLVSNYYNILYPLLELGKFEVAEAVYLKCESANSSNGFFLNWSGWIYQSWYELKSNDQQHLEKGLELYRRSTALIDQEFGKYSLTKYQNLENLGYTYTLINDHTTGLKYLDEAIGIVSKSYPTEITYYLGNLYEMKANALAELGQFDDALAAIDRSDRCKLLQVGAETSEMSWNYHTRAKILLKIGDKAAAKEALRKALDIREYELGVENEITITTREEFEAIVL